jgi:hypothetical protein
MKKFLITILAIVYLTSTVGAMVRLDCCLEKLVSYSVGTPADKHGDVESKGNCKDDHKQPKLGHEQKRSDSHIRLAKTFPASINTSFPAYPFQAVAVLKETYSVKQKAPKQAKIPIFLLNCVHRI